LVLFLQTFEGETEEFQPSAFQRSSNNFLKTPRYAMELIRGDVSSRLGASLANALLLDLKNMNLLDPCVDVNQILIDKAKLDREKSRMREKSTEIVNKGLEKLICVGVDGKIDKDTLVYKETKDEHGKIKLKTHKTQEHHLTFTNEVASEGGTKTGTYLTHRVIPVKGATGALLAEEVASVLEEYNSVYTVKAILLDNTNTNTGSVGGLVTLLEKKLSGNCTRLGAHFIKMSCHLERFLSILLVLPKLLLLSVVLSGNFAKETIMISLK